MKKRPFMAEKWGKHVADRREKAAAGLEEWGNAILVFIALIGGLLFVIAVAFAQDMAAANLAYVLIPTLIVLALARVFFRWAAEVLRTLGRIEDHLAEYHLQQFGETEPRPDG